MTSNGIRFLPQLFLVYAVLIVTKSANSMVTNSLPTLCRPDVLNPAIQCACAAYFLLFSEGTQVEYLKETCLQMLPDDIERGSFSCKDTRFMDSTGVVNVSIIDEFFHSAVKHCAYTDSWYQDRVEALRKEKNISSFGHISLDLSVRGTRRGLLHEKVLKFCLVAAQRFGLTRVQAYRRCRPRLSKPTKLPSRKPTPDRPEAEETPPSICQEETLDLASECGCKLYKQKYASGVTWTSLDHKCDESFGNINWSTSTACATFMESQRPGVPFNESTESTLDDYIDGVCESCGSFHVTRNSTCPRKVEQQTRVDYRVVSGKLLRYCIALAMRRKYSNERCYKNVDSRKEKNQHIETNLRYWENSVPLGKKHIYTK